MPFSFGVSLFHGLDFFKAFHDSCLQVYKEFPIFIQFDKYWIRKEVDKINHDTFYLF